MIRKKNDLQYDQVRVSKFNVTDRATNLSPFKWILLATFEIDIVTDIKTNERKKLQRVTVFACIHEIGY